MNDAQILTASQMRDAEQALFDTGISVFELMQRAAAGAAEWVRRIAAGRSVTVLCGPGNNGGDGYVIAHLLRASGLSVQVTAPIPPKTEAAQQALTLWRAPVQTSGGGATGDVLVDCLFGSGLSRALSAEHALLLRDLSARHNQTVAVDVPSGIDSDSGRLLNEHLPKCDVTLVLGAWKYAHWTLPGREQMGEMRLVPIGIGPVNGAAQLLAKPRIAAPDVNTHKYKRGLAAIVGGAMPGAAVLASEAAMRGGAGYVKLLAENCAEPSNPGLVIDSSPLDEALSDKRINAVLAGPGLGRGEAAGRVLARVLASGRSLVLDADALHLLRPGMIPQGTTVLATPHDGELEQLCRSFSIIAESRKDRAAALAKVSTMTILAKGADSVIASPDGRLTIAPPAPSWLSIAGSGDVLAGVAVSRLANGSDAPAAAAQAVWLHGQAARACGPAFAALDLARGVTAAMARA